MQVLHVKEWSKDCEKDMENHEQVEHELLLGQLKSSVRFLQKVWFYLKNKIKKYLNQSIVHR